MRARELELKNQLNKAELEKKGLPHVASTQEAYEKNLPSMLKSVLLKITGRSEMIWKGHWSELKNEMANDECD